MADEVPKQTKKKWEKLSVEMKAKPPMSLNEARKLLGVELSKKYSDMELTLMLWEMKKLAGLLLDEQISRSTKTEGVV